jgi:hypothetical protein
MPILLYKIYLYMYIYNKYFFFFILDGKVEDPSKPPGKYFIIIIIVNGWFNWPMIIYMLTCLNYKIIIIQCDLRINLSDCKETFKDRKLYVSIILGISNNNIFEVFNF